MAKVKAVICLVMLSVFVSEFVAVEPREIGYGSIGRDRIPCSKIGASQNNCNGKILTPGHPYTRGCSKVAKCRGPNSVDGQNQEEDNNEASGDKADSNNNGNRAN